MKYKKTFFNHWKEGLYIWEEKNNSDYCISLLMAIQKIEELNKTQNN